MAIEGPVTRWVADHRRHHAYSDKEGDPHSPWRYGTSFGALCKGLWHAHVGWLFDIEQTDQKRFAPDLLADKDVAPRQPALPGLGRRLAGACPALVGGAWAAAVGDGFWYGAATAFFWASLVRIARPAPRHLVDQLDLPRLRRAARSSPATSRATSGRSRSSPWARAGTTCTTPTRPPRGTASTAGSSTRSAELIRGFEKLGWATDVRWPKPRAPRRAPRRDRVLTAPAADTGRVTVEPRATRAHDRRAAARAAARRRPRAVRRARLRRHLRRGGRRCAPGVSKPVVYEHFGGKEGLYAVVVDREVQRLLTSFTGALTGDAPRELLEQATLALLTYVEDAGRRLPHPRPRVARAARRRRRLRHDHQRRRAAGGAHPGRAVRRARLPDDARRRSTPRRSSARSRWSGSGGSTRDEPRPRRGRRPPGEPGLERPVGARDRAATRARAAGRGAPSGRYDRGVARAHVLSASSGDGGRAARRTPGAARGRRC